jgi:Ca2+-binding RTX toxin-like protein
MTVYDGSHPVPDMGASGAVSEAVMAVRERERKIIKQLRLVVISLTLIIFASAAFVVLSAQKLIDEQAHTQTAITCALAAQTKVTTEYLSSFAKKFGGPLPPVPGLPHECGGDDPVFVGTSGNDVIDGTTDPDWINGEGGNDTLRAHGGGDTIIGYTGRDTLYGGKGTDYLYGGAGSDELHGGGDDLTDHLDGGDGTDTCYARSNDVVTNCEHIVRVVG